jgi:hypothetical protein
MEIFQWILKIGQFIFMGIILFSIFQILKKGR